MRKNRAIQVTVLVVVALALGVPPAMADRIDDLIAEAQQAKRAGDLAGAQRALTDVQKELTAARAVEMPRVGSGFAGAAPSGSAKTAPPIAAQPSTRGKLIETKSVFDELADWGFRLQLQPGKSGPAAEAATFAFDQNVKEGTETVFRADFLFGWNSAAAKLSGINPFTGKPRTVPRGSSSFAGRPNLTWYWDASVQGKLTSGDDMATDSWRFRIGLDADHTSSRVMADSRMNTDIINDFLARGRTMEEALEEIKRRNAGVKPGLYLGSWWSMSAKLEADRDFDNQRFGGELLVTPTTSLPGNGIIYPRDPKTTARFIWRPYLGIDAGGVIASDGTLDEVDDTVRILGRLDAMLSLDFLARALGFPSVELSISDKVNYLAESGDAYNYLSSQFRFGLANDVSLAFSYVNGEDAPSFEREERIGGSLAVKF